MTKHVTKLAGLTATLLALTAPAFADVKINDNFSISGYAVGSATTTEIDDLKYEEHTLFDSGASNLDSAKLSLLAQFSPFSATVSGFYIPEFTGAKREYGILDAFATYTKGTFSVTGGKFLSWLGYEAFDPINMTQLTYGATIFAIPAYHTGAKFDVSTEQYSFGAAVVDSVNPGTGFFQGDGEYSDDIGFEAYFTYKGIKNLTVFTGIAFEDTDGAADSLFVFDLWASYKVSDNLTLAAEVDVSDNVGKGWLAFAQYTFTPKFSVIGRVSGVRFDNKTDSTGVTVAPTYTFNKNFSIRAEVTLMDIDGTDATFFGVQGVFRF
jgi:hypothetical protein